MPRKRKKESESTELAQPEMFQPDNSAAVPIDVVAAAIAAASGDDDGAMFGKFNSDDDAWQYGPNNEPIPDDDYAVNLRQIKRGYVCWPDGMGSEPLGEEMALVYGEQAISKENLPHFENATWAEAVEIPIKGVESGLWISLRGTSKGFVWAFRDLRREIAKKVKLEAKNQIPVVALESETFYAKAFKRNVAKPVFTVVGWGNETELANGKFDAV